MSLVRSIVNEPPITHDHAKEYRSLVRDLTRSWSRRRRARSAPRLEI